MENFLSRVEEGYSRHKNPYHNNLHGADVAQTVHYMLCQTGLMVIINNMTWLFEFKKEMSETFWKPIDPDICTILFF